MISIFKPLLIGGAVGAGLGLAGGTAYLLNQNQNIQQKIANDQAITNELNNHLAAIQQAPQGIVITDDELRLKAQLKALKDERRAQEQTAINQFANVGIVN